MAKPKKFKFDPLWAKAKAVCRLNMEDIRMAKELGMSPKSLMKNRPSPSQQWKAPVKDWIRDLYEERFRHKARLSAAPTQSKPASVGLPTPKPTEDNTPF